MSGGLTLADLRAIYVLDATRNWDSYLMGKSLDAERERRGDEFDAAIAAHDARIASEAAEGALRGFADTWRRGDSNPWALHVKTVVKRRADRLANEREGAGDE